MNSIQKKYYDTLDDLCFYLRNGTLQITSGTTEYDNENLDKVFNENAELKIKISKAIEYFKYIIELDEDDLEVMVAKKGLEILGGNNE